MHFLRQSSDVVVAFDHLRGIALDGYTLNHIRIKSALREKSELQIADCGLRCEFTGKLVHSILKDTDEFSPDDFAFLLRVSYPPQFREKPFRCVDVFEFDVEILPEYALHDFFLSRAEQSVIDENAGKLISDRFVQERSSH
jgi:hypothetical protein